MLSPSDPDPPRLPQADRSVALRLARCAVEDAVRYRKIPGEIPASGIFGVPCGVFVTLFVAGQLHGCIGLVEPSEPLGDCITRCAASAALEDPRFAAMREADLPRLSIEISLLSKPEPIDPGAVELGRHGLIIARGGRRGLLLPQVATEHHLTRERFLEETCRKAGLPHDAWRDPATQIQGFTCEVFRESPDLRAPAA